MILPFDQAAADWYAKERARLQRQGKTCAYADGEIVAIAVLTLVTRNTQDFENFQGLVLQNWFE